MKKWILPGLLLVVAAAAIYDVRAQSNPCSHPLAYAIGSVDARFGLNIQELQNALANSERVWEKPMGKELFRYDPDAKFKVNLIFDDRQKRTNEERELRSKIDASGQSYDGLVEDYNSQYDALQQRRTAYESKESEFTKTLKAYNQEVEYWNKRKDITDADYARITAQKQQMQTAQKSLEQERLAINTEASKLNAQADRINALGRELNLDVEFYNGKFGKPKEFDQGVYTGNAIDIYQFSDRSDLTLVLAHELGHALKLDHVDNPEAVMYYLMQKQDLTNIHATGADIAALKAECKIK